MDESMFTAFQDELTKIAAKRDIGQLLSSLAKRNGINPAQVGGIRQASIIAGKGDRGRAADIATSVKGFLNAPAAERFKATHIMQQSKPSLGRIAA